MKKPMKKGLNLQLNISDVYLSANGMDSCYKSYSRPVSPTYQKQVKILNKQRQKNQLLLKNMLRLPIVNQVDQEHMLQSSTKLQRIITKLERDTIVMQRAEKSTGKLAVFDRFFFTEYYSQLTDNEKNIYQKIKTHMLFGENFIINADSSYIQGPKIQHAYNLDNIYEVQGKVLYRTGQLKLRKYDFPQFKWYIENKINDEIIQTINQLAKQSIESFSKSNCIECMIQWFANNINLSSHTSHATALHTFIEQSANSLGIARAICCMMHLFEVNCYVSGCLFQQKEHYFNIIQVQDDLYQCFDLAATLMNKQGLFIPRFHLGISMEQIEIDHENIKYFFYPPCIDQLFLSQHSIQITKIISFDELREAIKKAGQMLNQLSTNITKYYIDYLVNYLYFDETIDWLDDNQSQIQSIMLRYAPNFAFIEIFLPKTERTPGFIIYFERQKTQDFKLFPGVFSVFDEYKIDLIVDYIKKNISQMNKLVLPINTKADAKELIPTFLSKQDSIIDSLQDIFDSSDTLDSCIFRFSASAYCLVVIFIHVPMFNKVPKSARANRFSLQGNQRYIYSQIVSSVMNRIGTISIPYTAEISNKSLDQIIQYIRLDYPEIFFIPKSDIKGFIDDTGDYKVILSLQDFTVIQKQYETLQQAVFNLQLNDQQLLTSSDVEKEQLVISNIFNRIVKNAEVDPTATSVYDLLILKRLSRMSLACTFSYMCQITKIPCCTLQSASDNFCNIINLDQDTTIVDLFYSYQNRILTRNLKYFYPTASINIDCCRLSLIDDSYGQYLQNGLRVVLNYLYDIHSISECNSSNLFRLKQLIQEQIHNQKCLIAQIGYDMHNSRELVSKYLQKVMYKICGFLISVNIYINPQQYRIIMLPNLPVFVLIFYPELSIAQINLQVDDIEMQNQNLIIGQIKQLLIKNFKIVYLKLSNKTLPNLYQEQYEIHNFEKRIQHELDYLMETHEVSLKISACFDEFIILFNFNKNENKTGK